MELAFREVSRQPHHTESLAALAPAAGALVVSGMAGDVDVVRMELVRQTGMVQTRFRNGSYEGSGGRKEGATVLTGVGRVGRVG